MRYVSLLFFVFLFCTPDHLIQRSKADYLPLQLDNSWTYRSGVDSSVITVVGDTTIDNLGCFVVVFGDEYRYWHHDNDGVRQYSEISIGPSGLEYNLESRYYPLFPYPLVDGDSFADSFTHSDTIEGDSVYFFHRIKGLITLDDHDQYQVSVSELIEIHSSWLDSTDTAQYNFTLAPDIGIELYKDREGKIWDLSSYSVH